ncbi:MAG: nicotinamide riboside transporter PnuC [Tannerella sp.]|jgi:nicotinamide mononucleotide transporter|nr:nicotinamide riboside transporter PnuC [Tannerella sp.]
MDKFEIFAAAIGLLYLWLEYKANKWLWLVGIVMPLCYIYIFYERKFYAGMTVNVYYLFISAYGWWKWKRNADNKEDSFQICHVPLKTIRRLAVLFVTLYIVLAFVLLKFTDSDVVYSDTFINALSIIGMWMLAHKYIEQWWVWFVVNAVSVGVYFGAGLIPTAIMYAVYAVGSILGYYNWKRMKENQK